MTTMVGGDEGGRERKGRRIGVETKEGGRGRKGGRMNETQDGVATGNH